MSLTTGKSMVIIGGDPDRLEFAAFWQRSAPRSR